MKKLIALLAVIALGVSAACALSPSYKGYGELYSGYGAASGEKYDGGPVYGLSTSHGVKLMDQIFVGVGIDAAISYYKEGVNHKDDDYSGLFAVFAEGRYSFLKKRISPFVGVRIGGGVNGYDECGSFYFSPAAGCSFNLTKKFGLDASLGYSIFTGTKGGERLSEAGPGNFNAITLRVGVHF